MKEYKLCLAQIRTYLNNNTIKLNERKLDALISEELEKAINEMDTHLIDLCLNALVERRKYTSEREKS